MTHSFWCWELFWQLIQDVDDDDMNKKRIKNEETQNDWMGKNTCERKSERKIENQVFYSSKRKVKKI